MACLASDGAESLHLDIRLLTFSPPRERMTSETDEEKSHRGGVEEMGV